VGILTVSTSIASIPRVVLTEHLVCQRITLVRVVNSDISALTSVHRAGLLQANRLAGREKEVRANWLQKVSQMKAGSKRKSGQAPALSVKNWALWLKWLLKTAGPRIYFVVMLTGAFGLRCSEAIALKREDICLDGDLPRIKITGDTAGARKSPGDVYVRKQHLKLMQDHLKNGIRVDRQQGHKHGKGRKKQICKKDVFRVPLAGYIFTARKNSKVGHLHYHAVYDHIVKQAPKFYKHLRASGDEQENIDDHGLLLTFSEYIQTRSNLSKC
jgi:integrase